MLETIRSCIVELPNIGFPEFYQDFVTSAYKQAINRRIDLDLHRFSSLDSVNVIVEGLNQMTEELKQI